jgi:hypothetical protein
MLKKIQFSDAIFCLLLAKPITLTVHAKNKNRRCPKPQQVQSVECSNVAAVYCCAGLMNERTQRAALERRVGLGYYG